MNSDSFHWNIVICVLTQPNGSNHANKHTTKKSLRFCCCESKKVDLKIHEKELKRYRGIWVTIPWYEMRVLTESFTWAFVIVQN